MSWQIDWYKSYEVSDFTSNRCAYCSEPDTLYTKYDDGGSDVSVQCRNRCGFEVYAQFVDEGSQRVEYAAIYCTEENYVLYMGDGSWAFFFADGSQITEEGVHSSCIDVHEIAKKLRKLILLT